MLQLHKECYTYAVKKDDDGVNKMEINKLYSKFLTKNIPNYFLIDEVDRIYKEKYKANELDKRTLQI